ncbi:hypothetical protein [Longimicrobium terrae]|nr:hypothetical protein [Longimicrobium terrae]NNC32352.1 hypothetical protein [Longimicrobium terrae]
MRFRSLGLVVLVAVVTGCGCRGDCPRVARSPKQTIVAVDLSGSQTPETLRDSRAFVEKTIDSLSYGDHFVLMEMNRTGVGGALKRYLNTIPDLADSTFITTKDRDNLKGTKGAFRTIASIVFDTTGVGRIPHTDILATLFTASQYVHGADNRPATIILLSDMLQSANGIEMEGLRSMPPPGWIGQQRKLGTIPDLTGVCIVVVGADASTPAGVTIREFWSEYIKATGATLGPYVLLAPSPAELTCG